MFKCVYCQLIDKVIISFPLRHKSTASIKKRHLFEENERLVVGLSCQTRNSNHNSNNSANRHMVTIMFRGNIHHAPGVTTQFTWNIQAVHWKRSFQKARGYWNELGIHCRTSLSLVMWIGLNLLLELQVRISSKMQYVVLIPNNFKLAI